jgi:hypothetical protein
MGTWTEEQRLRLAFEKQLLAKELDDFWWEDMTKPGVTTIRGDYCSSAGHSYRLCVRLTSKYPYQMPDMYVISPCPLKGYGGKKINKDAAYHSMHIWPSDWNDYVKICHCKDEYWSASNTILGVLMKGILWLEALEIHRKNGKDIDEYSLRF